jgi:hypothetical protein
MAELTQALGNPGVWQSNQAPELIGPLHVFWPIHVEAEPVVKAFSEAFRISVEQAVGTGLG